MQGKKPLPHRFRLGLPALPILLPTMRQTLKVEDGK
jgi:hypothetical protein